MAPSAALVTTAVLASGVLAAASGRQAVIIDADPQSGDGWHPQCSQGEEMYLRNCVLGTDYFQYLLSGAPTVIANGSNCSSLGYTLISSNDNVSTGAAFSGFELYWMGGGADLPAVEGFRAYWDEFTTGHPDVEEFLALAKQNNPECTLPPVAASAAAAARPAAAVAAAAAAAPKPPVRIGDGAGDSETAIIFDLSGDHPQCAQGPSVYMRECVWSTDFFSYILSTTPTIWTNGSTCESLNRDFIYIEADSIFPLFEMYWAGGPNAETFFLRGFDRGHDGGLSPPQWVNFLNASKMQNPKCVTDPPEPPSPPAPPAGIHGWSCDNTFGQFLCVKHTDSNGSYVDEKSCKKACVAPPPPVKPKPFDPNAMKKHPKDHVGEWVAVIVAVLVVIGLACCLVRKCHTPENKSYHESLNAGLNDDGLDAGSRVV